MRTEPRRTDLTTEEPHEGGSKMLQISNALVGLHKEFYGRGPTKARSTLVREVLVVVLEGGFSQAERTLAESGRVDAVNEARDAMQAVIKDHWISAVENVLERRVNTFLSATDPVKQIQVEVFLMEPDGSPSHEDHGGTADGISVSPQGD